MKILITGTAGFIGFHLAERLLKEGHSVIGVDQVNAYYDVDLKKDRLAFSGIIWNEALDKGVRSTKHQNYIFYKCSLEDKVGVNSIFDKEKPDAICNLAAQAGVRYSLENPDAYIQSNIIGFQNIIEACRHYKVNNLCYASSSSVYGGNEDLPFSTEDRVDSPISLYAATKKSNELVAHTYSHLFGIRTTGLRFFTVYGPWGRPDMALYLFTKAIIDGTPIRVFNNGDMSRDFTYVDDIVTGVVAALDRPPTVANGAPHRVYNLGNSTPEPLLGLIETLETALGKKAEKILEPMQPGDVKETYADIEASRRDLGFEPKVPIAVGVPRFVEWYRDYHG